MERMNLGYSLKNIPIASKKSYMKRMLEKTESFVRRMRWKALFFEKPEQFGPEKATYGFKTSKAPPQMEHLIPFENDLYDLICNVQFDHRRSDFQKQLSKDVKGVQSSANILVPADKTTNLYSVPKEAYKKLLDDNITKAYKKTSPGTKRDIDRSGSAIASSLRLADRMEVYAERDAFITLKDHKDNFPNKPACRLINPAKSEVGVVSKQMVEHINIEVRAAAGYQQWRNTKEVIDWFKELPDQSELKFIKFDIVEFYPSISEELLSRSITYAKSLTKISEMEEHIIWHARQSLLFNGESTWVKKDDNMFDVTMGSFDGAEICELVGLYLLHLLSQKFDKKLIGLYRDDGLSALKLSGPQADRARKDIIKIFKECGLRVTVDILLTQTDFLDITLDLPSGKYWPYRKPNNEPLYINAKSNHPPAIIKHLPSAINSRIASISCNEEEFSKAKPVYEDALKKSGYKHKMEFETAETKPSRSRKRKVIWFNPPFNQNVKTNLAKRFLYLVDKHFPKHHRYHKLFNRSNVKVSYSCMNNMAAVISSHNAKVLNPTPASVPRACNCRQPDNCPLNGKCLTECVVYKATVTSQQNPARYYYGLTEGAFKTRFTAHTRSFRAESCRNSTELSKYVWDIRDKGMDYEISWDIAQRAYPYKCGTRRCDICLSEKMVIAMANPATMLNKRSEIISTCRHRAKYRYDKISGAST